MAEKNNDMREELAAEAARLRAVGALGRSELIIQLFDYLLARTLEGRSPKEIELAHDVFGKGMTLDTMQDASVRVYIHRLRKKLEQHYAAVPADADRLIVPRGEYRLALVTQALASQLEAAEDAEIPQETLPETAGTGRRMPILMIACAALVICNVAGWAAYTGLHHKDAQSALAANSIWAPFRAIDRPMFVVIGDEYVFGDTPDGHTVAQVVRDPAVASQDDLITYKQSHPALASRYVDLDLHLTPLSAGPALRNILPVVDALTPSYRNRVPVEGISQLTTEMLKKGHVIYVGFLRDLGPIRDPLFEASGFTLSPSGDELVDKASGQHFASNWGSVERVGRSSKDYGYIAGFPGPSGGRILVIAGTGDAAVMQMSELAADAKQLDRVAAQVGGSSTFEALYEVRNLGDVNVGSKLIVARPLHETRFWQPTRASPFH